MKLTCQAKGNALMLERPTRIAQSIARPRPGNSLCVMQTAMIAKPTIGKFRNFNGDICDMRKDMVAD
jgi:hypothetical protein